MKVQLFAPRSKAEIKKLPKGRLKITNQHLPNKPVGALWTSTWNGRGSDWTDWVEYNMEEWKTSKGILIQIQSSVKLYTISNSKDYEKLYDAYGIKPSSSSFGSLDWERISKKYDGVWVENPYAHKDLYGWDVESTAWFNMKVLKPLKVVDIK
jgi:hypothetical protein